MPVSYDISADHTTPAIHVIHENPDWTAPLFAALEARGLTYRDWNLAAGELALAEAEPKGEIINCMNDTKSTTANR